MPEERSASDVHMEKIFAQNAFFFLAHRQEILSDWRMFLSRVPVGNNLAYTGTNGFNAATLGVYLEWWETCTRAVFEEDGHKWLVWFIAGSPLSGSNRCSAVNEEGKSKVVQFSPFHDIWSTFIEINQQYDEEKSKYEAYTLEEVVNILKDKEKQGK